jgi:hypothetical protein
MDKEKIMAAKERILDDEVSGLTNARLFQKHRFLLLPNDRERHLLFPCI